jgi:two-component system chemotaxis sensor kinase CheA
MELAGGITPEDLKLFLQEADEQLQLLDEDIVRLEKEADSPDLMQEIFRAAHTLKGSSAMVGHQRMSDLAHAMENVLDNVRKNLLAISPQVVDALLHGLDIMRVLRKELVSPAATPTEITDAVKELAATVNASGQPGNQSTGPAVLTVDAGAKTKIEAAKGEGKQAYRVRIDLDQESGWASVRCFQILQELLPIADVVVSQPTQEEIEKGNAGALYELLICSQKNQDEIKKAISAAAETKNINITDYTGEEPPPAVTKAAASDVAAPKKEESSLGQTVRVDVSRLDTLMEQVGELVINRNQISQIGKTLGEKYHDDEIVHSLGDSVSQIAKIISTLQQDVMSIRLLPIEIVFNTLPRMVRDLARKENKKIDFIIEGQETEVDRSVIEHLRDPLVHLLRNSVDHGIEPPEDRLAAGKPETGTIKLSAYHEQDNIIIKLQDDGKGIDPAVLRQSAVKKNMLSAEAANEMTDEEITDLIFKSGFSTAKKVTEVSGRGVGLDVVKTNIEKLNGSINLTSKPGQGTTFILLLPLTLAIIPAMLVTSGETMCAVPLSAIVETNKLENKDIKTIRGREVALFRGNVLPLLRLNEVFGWERTEDNATAYTYIVIVKFSGIQVGIIVDSLLEQQELVVKSLDQLVGVSNGITGASILGDGRVVLILDIASLIRNAVAERQIVKETLEEDFAAAAGESVR